MRAVVVTAFVYAVAAVCGWVVGVCIAELWHRRSRR